MRRPAVILLLFCTLLPAATDFVQVWPILQSHCTTCHQAGEIGPMALTSYAEARPWAAAIREAVLSRTMPPWHAAHTSPAFANDRTLTSAEIATIKAWADSKAPEGPKLPPFQAATRTHSWRLGTPDLTLTIPDFPIPAAGSLPYSFLILPLHFTQDTWIRAAEFRIDRRAVIHHINAFVRPPGSSFLASFPANRIFSPTVADRGKRRASEPIFDRREMLLGYEPGYLPTPWPEGAAKLIRAGSDVVFEMHYNPNGTAQTDRSEIGIYFARLPPTQRVLAIDTLRDLDLDLPPNTAAALSHATMTLAAPVTLLSLQPHMHMRGKSMRVEATFPDSHSQLLIDLPQYDFAWQTTYTLRQPIALPAGTRLDSHAVFDNSPGNRFNPDPQARIRWGDQTTDEMHIAFLELLIPARANPEALLTAAPRMIGPASK